MLDPLHPTWFCVASLENIPSLLIFPFLLLQTEISQWFVLAASCFSCVATPVLKLPNRRNPGLFSHLPKEKFCRIQKTCLTLHLQKLLQLYCQNHPPKNSLNPDFSPCSAGCDARGSGWARSVCLEKRWRQKRQELLCVTQASKGGVNGEEQVMRGIRMLSC